MRFVDEIAFVLRSGDGGDGCLSFRRERYVPRGGPDGGDGGKGGSVLLIATRQRNTLVDFRPNKLYGARSGQAGGANRRTGADGPDLTLEVPLGTLVFHQRSGRLLADLAQEGATFVVPGGRGGWGNWHYKSSTRRTPNYAAPGRAGREVPVRLELKLIAEVGLLGFPNAGKSTLIRSISAARPKVADYPFTTLVPHLGVVRVDEGVSFVVADIPGLIDGAAHGAGLGHVFLRHVERCAAYVHLVAADDPRGSVIERYRALNAELRAYDDELLERPQIVALSKADLLPPEEVAALRRELEAEVGRRVFVVSAASFQGLGPLVRRMWVYVQDARDREGPNPPLVQTYAEE